REPDAGDAEVRDGGVRVGDPPGRAIADRKEYTPAALVEMAVEAEAGTRASDVRARFPGLDRASIHTAHLQGNVVAVIAVVHEFAAIVVFPGPPLVAPEVAVDGDRHLSGEAGADANVLCGLLAGRLVIAGPS